MAMVIVGSFTTGFVAGWLARSVTNATRKELIGSVATAHRMRDTVSRIFGQSVEWAEDLIAEGRAQYESGRACVTRGGHDPFAVNARPEVQDP